jgi:hypothetical protein
MMMITLPKKYAFFYIFCLTMVNFTYKMVTSGLKWVKVSNVPKPQNMNILLCPDTSSSGLSLSPMTAPRHHPGGAP